MEAFSIQEPEWYESIYLEKDYKSEAEYFINIFKNHNRQSPIILDVGAGTGKLFKYLNKHSERYIAVEPNKKFCNFMKNKFYKETNLEIKNCRFEEYAENINGNINLLISNFNVINYLNYESFIDICRNLYSKLNKGCIFIFDSWSLEFVINQKSKMKNKKFIQTNYFSEEDAIIRFSDSQFNIEDYSLKINFNFIKVNPKSMTNLGIENHNIFPFDIKNLIMDMKKQGWKIISLNKSENFNNFEDIDFSRDRNWYLAFQK